jgi:hypothetical protein
MITAQVKNNKITAHAWARGTKDEAIKSKKGLNLAYLREVKQSSVRVMGCPIIQSDKQETVHLFTKMY